MHRNVSELSILLLFPMLVALTAKGDKIEDGVSLEDVLQSLEPRSLLRNYKVFTDDVSKTDMIDTCDRDIMIYDQALIRRENWALKMLDASSKIPAGLMQGNIIDLGMYDECVAIRGNSLGVEVRGRHCMYSIAAIRANLSSPLNPTLSICVPSTCSDRDVVRLLNRSIDIVDKIKDIGITVAGANCASVDPIVWDNALIACTAVLLLYVSFLAVCSICDAAVEQNHPVLRIVGQFSFQRSVSAILNTKVKEGTLPVIHGIRFFSIAWIALGHEYVFQLFGANVNLVDVAAWIPSWKSLYIFIATFAVDTFFTLSGFLLAYLFLKEMPRTRKFNVLAYYSHRYIRLTPSVVALTVFSIVYLPKLGSGPRWDVLMKLLFSSCRRKWWTNILYIQNFVDQENMCLGHLWYLAVDMQLFWISPLLLYPLYRQPKVGLAILGIVFAASIITPAVIIGINEYPVNSFTHDPNITLFQDLFEDIYEKPHTRAGPWIVGIYFGYLVANEFFRLSKLQARFGWSLATFALVFCTFGTRSFLDANYVYNPVWETFFSAVSRPLWGFAISWMIYASAAGFGGPVSSFLSWRFFTPLSRISYCLYLVHLIIQNMQVSALRVPRYFSDFHIWNYYLADLLFSILVAFIFSLLFESPVLVLEKLIFRKKRQVTYERQKDVSEINDERNISVGRESNAE